MPSTTAASNTYVVEPEVLDRFPVELARGVAREALRKAYSGVPYSTELTKGVADSLRDQLRGSCPPACDRLSRRLTCSFYSPACVPGPNELRAPHPHPPLSLSLFLTTCVDIRVPRYKIFVQVTVFESKSQGARVASRALWNSTTDFLISETFTSDALWAVATIAAVYTP